MSKKEPLSLDELFTDDDKPSVLRAITIDTLIPRNTNPAELKINGINFLVSVIHERNKKWWTDIDTGERVERNKGELLCLIHSEVSEAMEGARRDKDDDHLPHLKSEVVELADAVIRIMDYCGGFCLDLQGAIEEKLAYNAKRADHTHEARRLADGKKF